MKKVLLILGILSVLCIFTACGQSNEPEPLTSYGAECAAQEYTKNDIASKAGLEWYSIEWGTCDSEILDETSYSVELNGNISGYSDKAKVNYHGKRAFRVTAIVTSSDKLNIMTNGYSTVSDVKIFFN